MPETSRYPHGSGHLNLAELIGPVAQVAARYSLPPPTDDSDIGGDPNDRQPQEVATTLHSMQGKIWLWSMHPPARLDGTIPPPDCLHVVSTLSSCLPRARAVSCGFRHGRRESDMCPPFGPDVPPDGAPAAHQHPTPVERAPQRRERLPASRRRRAFRSPVRHEGARRRRRCHNFATSAEYHNAYLILPA